MSELGTWDEFADIYDEAQGETGDLAHSMVYDPVIQDVLGDIAGKTVLDAGSGNGCWARRLHSQGAAQVLGVDYSAELVRIAAAKQNPENIHFVVGGVNALGIADGRFDTVLSSMVLHYIKDIEPVAQEFARVLKPNGEAVICVQHPTYQYHHRAQERAGKPTSIFSETLGYFTVGAMTQVTLAGRARLMTYNRTIEAYVKPFLAHGLLLADLREPQFTEAFLEAMPQYREVAESPRVLVVKFLKPA